MTRLPAFASPLATAPARRSGLAVLAAALAYWAAIELWGQLLNRLNGVAGPSDLLPGQVVGVCGAALISSVGYLIARRSAAAGVWRQLTVGAGSALASSSLYALGMMGLARWLPVSRPQGAFGLAHFAWETLFFLIPFSLWTVIVMVLESGRLGRERDARLSEALISAREAEVRALHYQVNPHFLYNALNSLSTLILEGRAEQADDMVHRLAAFFRSSLTRDPLTDVCLADEVAQQQLYLALEELRFTGRLSIDVDLAPDLRTALVPSLILQPLVENAVKHGVHAPGRTTRIAILATRRHDALRLEVRDNGPAQTVAATPGTGVGLDNVRRRLKARYGDLARLDTVRDPDGGFVARIDMPLQIAV